MNIEKYAKIAPQYYTGEIPKILCNLFSTSYFPEILDCGCGDGSLVYAILKSGLAKKAKINAIDLSKKRINLIKKISRNIIAREDSAETLKTVKTNSVNLLISTQVVEHVDDKKMEIAMKRVVKKNGVVYLSTVFKKWYGWYFYRNDSHWVLDPTHIREYTMDSQLIDIFKNDFIITENKKTLQWFPVIDFITKRIGIISNNRDSSLWKLFRSVKIPIFGYYNWELVLVRK